MSKFFDDLKESLEEVIAYKKGKLKLDVETFVVPDPPKKYKAKDIKILREKRDYSQNVFAIILNVSKKTVQAWESGRRNPSHSALRLLEIIDKNIYNPEATKKSQSK